VGFWCCLQLEGCVREVLDRSVERRTSLPGESTVFILLTGPISNAANQQNNFTQP